MKNPETEHKVVLKSINTEQSQEGCCFAGRPFTLTSVWCINIKDDCICILHANYIIIVTMEKIISFKKVLKKTWVRKGWKTEKIE